MRISKSVETILTISAINALALPHPTLITLIPQIHRAPAPCNMNVWIACTILSPPLSLSPYPHNYPSPLSLTATRLIHASHESHPTVPH